MTEGTGFCMWCGGYDSIIEDDPALGVPFGSTIESGQCALEGGAVEGGDGFVFGAWLGGRRGTCLVRFSRKGWGG